MMETNEMIATKIEQAEEAKRRMEKLGIAGTAQALFESGLLVSYECLRLPGGGCIVLDGELPQEMYEKINAIEEQYGIEVYAVIESHAEFGHLYDCLYVTKYKEEWEMDYELFEDDCTMSYCINVDEPMFSEFGSIAIENVNGSLCRTC